MDDQNDNQNDQPESRRDMISASFDAMESEANSANPAGESTTGHDTQTAGPSRTADGRFAPKAGDVTEAQQAAPAAAAAPSAAEVAAPAPAPTLTTWRKEYLPIQQKLADGLPLTAEEANKLAAYNVQREKEYSTGVSTYKAEAMQARELTQAMSEFMPILQQHGMQPAAWIQNLGRAHHTLAMGSPEQKLQMFSRLAQDYGVPLAAVSQAQAGQFDPALMQVMQELQNVKQNLQGVTSWRQQQEQQIADQQEQAAQQEISKFTDAAKYPHFDQVREQMARLLETGMAQTPDEAYAKAVRLDETVFGKEQERQAAAQQAAAAQSRQAAVAKAKGASVSVRTATPSGTTGSPVPTNRRAALDQAFDAYEPGRV